ncbi:MAG: hypothetical protein ACTHM2_09250 [Afipia sp.]
MKNVMFAACCATAASIGEMANKETAAQADNVTRNKLDIETSHCGADADRPYSILGSTLDAAPYSRAARDKTKGAARSATP